MSSPAAGAAVNTGAPTGVRGDQLGAIAAVANAFDPITLAGLGTATLMDRVDTKFLVPASAVAGLLEACSERYRLLDVHGTRVGAYNTRYFDTPCLRLYHEHHAGRVPRYKVRVRTYLNTRLSFLEVKLKTNKARTRKSRVSLDSERADPMERLQHEAFFGIEGAVSPSRLRETLSVDYSRITLVSKDAAERITVDLFLTVSLGGVTRAFPGLAIAEVKQERHGRSPFTDAIRALALRPGALSKYCLGIATLEPRVKRNNFQPVLRRIDRLERQHLVLLNN